jgi:hypothetical protein
MLRADRQGDADPRKRRHPLESGPSSDRMFHKDPGLVALPRILLAMVGDGVIKLGADGDANGGRR